MDIDPIVLAKGLDDAFNEKEIKLTEEEVQLTLVKFRQEFQQKQREIAQRKAQEAAKTEEKAKIWDIKHNSKVQHYDDKTIYNNNNNIFRTKERP